MKTVCAVVFIGILGMAFAQHNVMDRLGWEGSYQSALDSIARRDGGSVAAVKINLVTISGVTSPHNPVRNQAQALVGEIELPMSSSVLLEFGNANLGSYYFVWAVESPNSALVLTNVCGRISKEEIESTKYSSVWKGLVDHGIWSLESDADLGVNDGTAYFLSVFAQEKSHQAVFYAPPDGERTATDRGLVGSGDDFSSIAKQLVALGRQSSAASCTEP